MRVPHWLRPLAARRARLRLTFRPRVEGLESRDTPSGGLLDPTFGSGGIVTDPVGPSNDFCLDVAVQSDGKIVAAGRSVPASGGGTDFSVARYNPDGTRDATFGSGGVATVNLRYYDNGHAVAVLPDGKILVAGSTTTLKGFKEDYDFAVARFNANGTIDTTFGAKRSGWVATDLGSVNDFGSTMIVQPDGKVVVAGTTSAGGGVHTLGLVRYNTNGSLDTTYGSGGKVISAVNVLGNSDPDAALDPSGRIVLAGNTAANDFLVARFLANGQADPSFGVSGRVTTDFLGGADDANSVLVQPDGKIVAGGSSFGSGFGPWGRFALARYNPNGTLDAGFGQNGLAVAALDKDPTPGSVVGEGAALQADGKLLVAGRGGYQGGANGFALIRFNPDGTPDVGYGTKGTGGVFTLFGTYANAAAVAVQPDGKAVVAGRAELNGSSDFALTRYLASAPQVGSFTAAPNPAPAGDPVTLTAGSITNGNPGATTTQVAFYRDSNSDGKLDASDELLGYGSQNAGTWSLTVSTAGWAAGTFTLFAQATDSYGALGDPLAATLQVT